ncbi:RhoGEF domain containing protein [Ceratobasidium theobromae]|uniref:RhoGEF domain containing protein n=1 Tax=Ceratobasidium theobromae TaxID=1582974 RepID=A0A5N5QIZ0_9AGAM|nr:RhoGEF domain containing protein [Ceratobasidium theobromae]
MITLPITPQPESASTRTTASQVSLLVDSPERAHPKGPPPPKTKRTHALLELLSSERAYASDLALVRDIYLPLARGRPSSYPLPSAAHKQPDAAPMGAHDVKVVFANIEQLAAFADELTDRLEAALGHTVPGGSGPDCVGALFCELAPRIAPMYLTYITRHPAAVARYTALAATPAMAHYLATTRAMTSSITHAWDIPRCVPSRLVTCAHSRSLIIKPLQRLLKYPLILQTILDDTPPDHPDRAALAHANEKMQDVARQVNEGRRRWEVVKGVLESGNPKKIKLRPKSAADSHTDLDRLESRVTAAAAAANSTADHVVAWADHLVTATTRLLAWSRAFARVVDLDVLLGGDPQGGSEAVKAFTAVSQSLQDLSRELAAVIKEELVPQLQRLARTTREPLLLLAHMHTLASAHHNLVNTPYSKSPPPALLEASQAYVALVAQLRDELPRYVDMFERAQGIILLRLSGWQARYFQEAERRWKEFWLALNVEESQVAAGESAAVETLRIWWARWEATACQMSAMAILAPHPKRVYGKQGRTSSSHPRQSNTPDSSDSYPYHSRPSAHSLGDLHKGHARALSTELVPRNRSALTLGPRVQSDPAPERLLPKSKKSQRGSNLRRVTDTLFGGTPETTAASSLSPSPARTSSHSSSSRLQQPVLYAAAAIHPFDPETDATHLGLPFLRLEIGDTLEILVEAGHPSEHSNLPIPYDDAPDCMLAARNEDGTEGWALASYLMPLA